MGSNRSSQDVLAEYTERVRQEKADQEREKQALEEQHKVERGKLIATHKEETAELKRRISKQSKLTTWQKTKWEGWCKEKTDELKRINDEHQDTHVPSVECTSSIPDNESTKSNEMPRGRNKGSYPITSSSDDLYVEEVIGKKTNNHGKFGSKYDFPYCVLRFFAYFFSEHIGLTLYFVRWAGYGPEADTWEPITHIANTGQIDRFEFRQKCKHVQQDMPGVALLEYDVQGGGTEQMMMDMREVTFRPHTTTDTDWEADNDYSVIKQGQQIDVYWPYEGSYYSCKVK